MNFVTIYTGLSCHCPDRSSPTDSHVLRLGSFRHRRHGCGQNSAAPGEKRDRFLSVCISDNEDINRCRPITNKDQNRERFIPLDSTEAHSYIQVDIQIGSVFINKAARTTTLERDRHAHRTSFDPPLIQTRKSGLAWKNKLVEGEYAQRHEQTTLWARTILSL